MPESTKTKKQKSIEETLWDSANKLTVLINTILLIKGWIPLMTEGITNQ